MTSIPSTANPPKRMSIRRSSLKELETLIVFLIITVLVECLVVLYAMSVGVKDQMPLQWSFTFPGTASRYTLSISPLFNLVPIAVILTLVANWAYLRRQVLIRPGEPQRGKLGSAGKGVKRQRTLAQRFVSTFSRRKKTTSPGREVRVRRTNVRSALIVLVPFSALLILISLFAYPALIYNAIATAYKNDPSLLNFVKGIGAAVTPIGRVFSPINSFLLAVAPGFRDFVVALGAIITPLATLDNDGKYLVFQNAAAWISTLVILFYGKYGLKSLRQARK
jgi:hypothetical protein